MLGKTRHLILISLCVMPSAAWANIGVPMIFVTMPAMLIGLIPVIAIEACIMKRRLSLTSKRALMLSGTANAMTTIIGIPLTWGGLLVIEMAFFYSMSVFAAPVPEMHSPNSLSLFFSKFLSVTLGAPWLGPVEKDLGWMVPAAMLFLLLPFFFMSWKMEYFITRKMEKQADPATVKAACLRANAVTYALFSLYPPGLYFFLN